ncbi:MAG TPA: efflux RND transporter periplasmic adaptor subunit [Gemmatimonadales bacterium]|nr:efflux RND transporter periplasmic adaptor subunit [Gemmatimonadales bacterium]
MKRYIPLALLLTACSTGRSEEAASADTTKAPAVVLGSADVATVIRADLVAGVPVSGTLEPTVKVQIISPYPEVVEEVLVREGQAVERGQILARFRSDALEPAALSAEAQRRIAASDHERMKNLFQEGAVSARDVENAEVSLRAAEANEAAARKRLQEALIRAPVSGTVSRKAVDSGDRVGDGVFMLELINTRDLEFAATVRSEYVASVRVGAPVALSGEGLPAAGVGGRVARINATADPATRQVKIYVNVANRDRRLVAGLFASGRVVLSQVKQAVAVPREAVRTDAEGKSYVLVVADGRIERRDVTVGAVDEVAALTEIKTGLSGGETAVVGPAEGLLPGQPVTITGREG